MGDSNRGFGDGTRLAIGALERGRECYRQRAWAEAYRLLDLADRADALAAEDLERLAMAAYLTGLDDEYLQVLERAHHARLNAGEHRLAARCAFWLGFRAFLRGEVGRATGWLARAQRLVEDEDECPERATCRCRSWSSIVRPVTTRRRSR
jgi:hypothetical protein